MATERKTQYQTGWDDAIEGTMLLLTMGIDFYPRIPSEDVLKMIMPPHDATRLLNFLAKFHEKFVGDVERRIQEASGVSAST